MVQSTYNSQVLSQLGGFSGLFCPDFSNLKEPVLVSGTDGVGTKVDLAFRMDKHDSVGIDCVAMCVNDILCQGAKPLFFLDYIATGKLVPQKMAQLVAGVVEGCKQAGAALIGGETAEMPGIYQPNHYDLAGFVVGVVDKAKMINGEKIKPGDVLIGLKSSGFHSNGFSLIRKIIFEKKPQNLNQTLSQLDKSLADALLTPTRIYVKTVLPLIEKFDILGISHITGGGFFENIPRMLPNHCHANINVKAYEVPPIFKLIQEWGELSDLEMYHTFATDKND